jgi:hypothetical protein
MGLQRATKSDKGPGPAIGMILGMVEDVVQQVQDVEPGPFPRQSSAVGLGVGILKGSRLGRFRQSSQIFAQHICSV